VTFLADHADARLLAAGSALDDLDPSERRAYEAHVLGCGSCRSLSWDLDDVLGDLALLAPARRPPDALRRGIMDALRVEPSADIVELRRSTRRLRTVSLGAVGLAAALAVVAVGIGARTVELSDAVAANTAALAAAEARLGHQAAAMALVADPAHVTASLHAESLAPTATAVVLYRPGTTDSYLMADRLPATPAGSVYQLWYADAAGVHALGTFTHDGRGPLVVPFGVDLGASAATMVTLEPVGGARGEPGPQVVFGEL
jgi:hypothetical protein